jgi:hypothetical protein
MKQTELKAYNKYALYERSVQSPELHVRWLNKMFLELRARPPRSLREDFSGTFLLCREWVRYHPQNTAIAIDLDPEPLEYGKATHFPGLTKGQKKRITLRQADVVKVRAEKVDLISVGNFSYFIFKERESLRAYFVNCLRGMQQNGVILLELAGGPGMIQTGREQRAMPWPGSKTKKFTYVWDQKSFDPISNEAKYGIHFKLPNGRWAKNAFEYDWRIWSVPETREILREAGFSSSVVFWETSHRGHGTGEYARTESGDNAYSWIAYVAGLK